MGEESQREDASAGSAGVPAAPQPPLLDVRGVHKRFGGAVAAAVLAEVDFQMRRGEFVALVGPSGAGKTTLLNIIATLDAPTAGAVLLDGVDVHRLDQRDLNRLRNRRLGFVFQDDLLLDHLTALENVMLPARIARRPARRARRRARALLTRVGLADRTRHLPGQLSGGQRQRVNLARALVNEPSLLLADEPTARLDQSTGRGIIQLLVELNEQWGVSILMVTHEHELAQRVERIVEFRDGRVLADRRPAPPAHPRPPSSPRPTWRGAGRLGYLVGSWNNA